MPAEKLSLWDIKALNISLTVQIVASQEPTANWASSGEEGKGACKSEEVRLDHRLSLSNTAQAVEMKYYLKAGDWARASSFLKSVIMPQIDLSLRREQRSQKAVCSAKHPTAMQKPDLAALIAVALDYLYLKHAQLEGDASLLSFREVERALRDEEFFGESQICIFFTPQDLEQMMFDGEVDAHGFAVLLRRIRFITLRRQRVVLLLDEKMQRASQAIVDMQSDVVEEMVADMKALSQELHAALTATTATDGVLSPESHASHAAVLVLAMMREEMAAGDSMQPSQARHSATLLDAFNVLYDRYFSVERDGGGAAGFQEPFVSVLAYYVRVRIEHMQQVKADMQQANTDLGLSAMATLEQGSRDLRDAVCALDMRLARQHFMTLEEAARDLMVAVPPAVARSRTKETQQAASKYLFEVPPVSQHMRDAEYGLVGTKVLELYYCHWDHTMRAQMPLLLVFREAADRILDSSLRLISCTKRRLSAIAAPHKTDAAIDEDEASALVEKRDHDQRLGTDEFEAELLTITSEEFSKSLMARCCVLRDGLWCVQRAFTKLLQGSPEDCQEGFEQAFALLSQSKLEDNFYFRKVLETRSEQLRRAQRSADCLAQGCRLLAHKPGVKDPGLTLISGDFVQATLDRAKAESPSAGWRLSSEPVRLMVYGSGYVLGCGGWVLGFGLGFRRMSFEAASRA